MKQNNLSFPKLRNKLTKVLLLAIASLTVACSQEVDLPSENMVEVKVSNIASFTLQKGDILPVFVDKSLLSYKSFEVISVDANSKMSTCKGVMPFSTKEEISLYACLPQLPIETLSTGISYSIESQILNAGKAKCDNFYLGTSIYQTGKVPEFAMKPLMATVHCNLTIPDGILPADLVSVIFMSNELYTSRNIDIVNEPIEWTGGSKTGSIVVKFEGETPIENNILSFDSQVFPSEISSIKLLLTTKNDAFLVKMEEAITFDVSKTKTITAEFKRLTEAEKTESLWALIEGQKLQNSYVLDADKNLKAYFSIDKEASSVNFTSLKDGKITHIKKSLTIAGSSMSWDEVTLAAGITVTGFTHDIINNILKIDGTGLDALTVHSNITAGKILSDKLASDGMWISRDNTGASADILTELKALHLDKVDFKNLFGCNCAVIFCPKEKDVIDDLTVFALDATYSGADGVAFNANQSKWPYGDYWAKESNLNKVKEVAPELLALMSANEESIVIFVDGINQLYIVSKTTGKWIKFTK